MPINYKEVESSDFERIKEIYESCSWFAYLKDDAKLMRAFENNLFFYGAYDNDLLIGFIRCVGDGEHILLVQDLIVHKDYQQQGVGSYLFSHTENKYKHVRMFLVVTDIHDEVDNKFYQKRGLSKIAEKDMVAYAKLCNS